MYVRCLRQGAQVLDGCAPQVHHDTESGRRVYLDGQIHNLPELAVTLELAGNGQATPAATEIIAAAYQTWGENCVRYFLGEFVFSIVDPGTSRFFCARDQIGIKPFFYYLDSREFVFGSDLRQLTRGDVVPVGVCDEAVAIYLRRGELYHPTLTFHQSIVKLPPAETLTVSEAGVARQRYWKAEDCPRVELDSLEAYSTRLRGLLDEAVKSRVDPDVNMGAHLSGGLDSSTIVAIAAPEVTAEGAQLHTFSWNSPPMDAAESQAPEWANAEQVAAASGAHHHYSDFTGDDLLHILENHNLMDHDSVDLWYEFGVRKQARNRGVKTMLSGWGGDQFITAYGNERYAETFWRGQIFASVIDLYRATAGSPRRLLRFFPLFFREVLLPVLPSWATFKGSEADFYSYDYLACATEAFEAYTRKLQKWPSPSPGITVRRQQLDEYEVNHLVNRLESWAVSGKQVGIEYRYPLLDRRLVEFALGIPADLYRRRGIPRYLFRRTVRELLPRAIWEDTLKEEPIRVQRLLLASREALIRWRDKYAHCDTPNRFIDRQRLYQLIDEIDGWGPELSIPQIFKILSAIKSILVLNMSIEKEHPDAGARARHDGNTTSARSSWDDPAKWKGASGEQILPDDKPAADFDASEWQW